MAGTVLPLLTSNSYWGLAVETSYAASVAPTIMTPINSPKVTPGVKWLLDQDFRGSPVMDYDNVAGVFNAQFDGKTYTYTDVFPNLLRATLGSNDAVASVSSVSGSGGTFSASTHTIGLQNQPNTGSQSPSYSLWNDSVDASYLMTGSRMDSLNISFAADAAVENTFSFKTNQPIQLPTSASVSSASTSTQHLIPAWNCAASIGGQQVFVVESWELDLKRSTNQIYALGSESPVSNFQSAIDVTGKCTFIVQQGETYWANALVRNQQQVLLNLIDPFTGYGILFQTSTVQLTDPVINQGKNYVELDLNFTAIANQVDTVTFGYSPIKCVVTNGVSTAY